eukprot:CAMPEP_0168461644 /NCGR_PEP_ID=MMETSP0228-20121227/54090_1 /TAXON_ID=133427 /ORGANISM="Protoceratium reticulatum, Strain CCCM 535 (=CCMP 1889)" /LENGTH=68 /DNA_ID=CAMNT_0008476963 /DNA_START=9 /DNA_END=215 /DNA_ORIENTATION=+
MDKDNATGEISHLLQRDFPDVSTVHCHVPTQKVEVGHGEMVAPGDLLERLQKWGRDNQKPVELVGTAG